MNKSARGFVTVAGTARQRNFVEPTTVLHSCNPVLHRMVYQSSSEKHIYTIKVVQDSNEKSPQTNEGFHRQLAHD
jgi:hypothetical protein